MLAVVGAGRIGRLEGSRTVAPTRTRTGPPWAPDADARRAADAQSDLGVEWRDRTRSPPSTEAARPTRVASLRVSISMRVPRPAAGASFSRCRTARSSHATARFRPRPASRPRCPCPSTAARSRASRLRRRVDHVVRRVAGSALLGLEAGAGVGGHRDHARTRPRAAERRGLRRASGGRDRPRRRGAGVGAEQHLAAREDHAEVVARREGAGRTSSRRVSRGSRVSAKVRAPAAVSRTGPSPSRAVPGALHGRALEGHDLDRDGSFGRGGSQRRRPRRDRPTAAQQSTNGASAMTHGRLSKRALAASRQPPLIAGISGLRRRLPALRVGTSPSAPSRRRGGPGVASSVVPASLRRPCMSANADETARALHIVWCGRTVTGQVRSNNEDNLWAAPLGAVESPERRLGRRDRGRATPALLLAVADGMGGALAGEVASRLAVETLGDEMARRSRADQRPRRTTTRASARSSKGAIEAANALHPRRGREQPAAPRHGHHAHRRLAARGPGGDRAGRRQPGLPLPRRAPASADEGPEPRRQAHRGRHHHRGRGRADGRDATSSSRRSAPTSRSTSCTRPRCSSPATPCCSARTA